MNLINLANANNQDNEHIFSSRNKRIIVGNFYNKDSI